MAAGAGADLSYFGLQSAWGVTKHLGGRAATDRLVELCGITSSTRVLEVGCGVGVTSNYLAAEVGCALTSVDLSEKMVGWAAQRAARRGVADRISFLVADAQALPFADGSFDAVISESVTAFAPDQHRAVGEYRRVLAPGGTVGLAEASWIRTPAPAGLVNFLSRAMEGARFHDPEGWTALLEGGGFVGLTRETARLTARSQLASDLSGQDRRDVADRFRAMGSFVWRSLVDAEVRGYARSLMPSIATMRDLFRYFGYGIYAARTPG